MAALSPSATPRVYLDYNDGVYDHTLMLRYVVINSDTATVMGVMAAFLSNLDPQLYQITILGARESIINSDVTNPVTWTGAATYGTGVMPEVNAPKELSFTGKTQTGRRWRVSVFGCLATIPDSWRFVQTANSDLDDARDGLNTAMLSNQICAITGTRAVVNTAMPISYNDHFIVKNRG